MHDEDLVLVGVIAGLGVLFVLGIVAAVLRLRRRNAAFRQFSTAPGWSTLAPSGEWIGPVARATFGALTVDVGRARLTSTSDEYMRFRAHASTPFPPGLYVHSQHFSRNTAPTNGPRPRYDGAYDDPSTTSLFGSVPEIVLGDAELDRALVIQGDDERSVRWFLTRPAVRARLLDLCATGDHVRLRDGFVDLDVDQTKLTTVEDHSHRVSALVALASVLAPGAGE